MNRVWPVWLLLLPWLAAAEPVQLTGNTVIGNAGANPLAAGILSGFMLATLFFSLLLYVVAPRPQVFIVQRCPGL